MYLVRDWERRTTVMVKQVNRTPGHGERSVPFVAPLRQSPSFIEYFQVNLPIHPLMIIPTTTMIDRRIVTPEGPVFVAVIIAQP